VIWIQSVLGPAWEAPLRVVSALGSSWGVILVAGLAFWLWGRRALYAVLVVLVAETVVKKAVAAVLFVPRPEAAGVVKYEEVQGVSSFPSGHVSSATGLWAALAWLGHIPVLAAAGVGLLVGLSRVYLGVHWLTDVVAAVLLALGVAWVAVRYLHPPVTRALERRSPRFWWMLGAAVAGLSLLYLGTLASSNAFAWTSAGLGAGLGVALPAERSWVDYRPPEVSPGGRAARVAVGVMGLLPFFTAARLADEGALGIRALLAFGGTLWALLAAPALFSAWQGSGSPRPEGASGRVDTRAGPSREGRRAAGTPGEARA
jgi:membrane-associated phospholipid phosphatase